MRLRSAFHGLRRALLAASLALAGSAHAAVQALLLSVNDYRESGVPELSGPPNDVALVKSVLTGRFALPEGNVKVLRDPTHGQIEAAFAELAGRVRPGDQVYIHYSGHGSWSPAPPAGPGETAERRGQDQTWVGFGSRSKGRQGKDAWDVLDKEIALWLDPIYRITPDVVFVSDSCHSASASRGEQLGVRSVDAPLEPHPLRATIRRVAPPTVGLRIGAARDFESAVEFDPRVGGRCQDKTNCYGAFTWYWASALTASRPDESWGDVFQRASAALLATPGVLQRPQMEGVADRAVFQGRFARPSSLVSITEVARDGTVKLGAGLLAGVTAGSRFEGDGARPVQLEVTAATAGSAEARSTSGTAKAGDVVREVEHRVEPIRLFIGTPDGSGVDAALVAQVRRAIVDARPFALQNFDIVDARERADWRLELVRPEASVGAQAGVLPAKACRGDACPAAELWVVSPIGQLMHEKMRIPLGDPAQALPRLVSNLGAFAHVREVRAIGAQGNPTALQPQVQVWRPVAGDPARCADGVRDGSAWTRSAPMALSKLAAADVRRGDCLAFTLVNSAADRSWYGYLLGVDPGFKVEPIWPAAGANQDEARIEPKTSYAVADTYYRLSDPGRVTFLFVASQAAAPVNNVVHAGMRGASNRTDALTRLIHAGTLTRGTETAVGDWGAQSLDVDIADTRSGPSR